MGVSMNLHGGTWEEYDAVLRPEITAVAARVQAMIRRAAAPTIVDGCHELGLPLPVSAADLHETYVAFRLAGIEPNTSETPCWRGVCNCLESYGADPKHAEARQRIMEHLEMLTPEREPD